MKRAHTLTIALAILALTGVSSLTTSAFARPWGPGADRLTRLGERIDSLGLDDQTRTQIHTTIDGAQTTLSDLRSQLHDAHKNLRALLAQAIPDENAVLTQSEAIGSLETAYRKQTLSTLLAVRALLTPEQRASLRGSMRYHGPSQKSQGN